MNSSYHMVNYNTTHQNMATSQDLIQDDHQFISDLHPAKKYIIQLICYLLQVVIVICQQLEMIYQLFRQCIIQTQRVFNDNKRIFYPQSHINSKKTMNINRMLFLVCRTFSLSLCIMLIFGVTWMFHQAGF